MPLSRLAWDWPQWEETPRRPHPRQLTRRRAPAPAICNLPAASCALRILKPQGPAFESTYISMISDGEQHFKSFFRLQVLFQAGGAGACGQGGVSSNLRFSWTSPPKPTPCIMLNPAEFPGLPIGTTIYLQAAKQGCGGMPLAVGSLSLIQVFSRTARTSSPARTRAAHLALLRQAEVQRLRL